MTSSADSPHPKPILCRKSSSASCNASSVVMKEIRSSLFLATSIIEDDVPDDYSPMIDGHRYRSTVHFECGRLKYSHVKGVWSILHRSIHTCEDNMQKSNTGKNPVAMVIASLWPVPVPKQYAAHSANRTKKTPQSIHINELSTKLEIRQNSRKRRKLLNDEDDIVYDIDDDCCGSIDNSEVDHNMVQPATTGSMLSSPTPRVWLEDQPTLPPIELVRCILNGAEFIAMMNCARREVETSIHKKNDDVDVNSKRVNKNTGNYHDEKAVSYSKARFWSRRMAKNLKRRSINLQPMIVALAAATIDANLPSSKQSPIPSTIDANLPSSKPSPLPSIVMADKNDSNIDKSSLEIIMLKFIDECIRFAHIHTLDLIAPWSSCWQMRTNLRSEQVETIIKDENCSLSVADTTFATKYRVMSRLDQKGIKKCDASYKNKKENSAFISFDATTTIQKFVRACLEQPREDIVRSKMSMMSSTISPFNNCDTSREYNNDNYHRVLSPAPKRTKVSRRSKVFTREPADSLAATCTKRSQNSLSSATKHLSTFTKKEPLLEKQRQRRVKYSRHIFPPSPSVLENTTTVISQGNGRLSRTTRSGSLSLQMTRNRRRTREKTTAIKKDHDTNDPECDNTCEVGLEKEKMSPNSLYELFDKNRKQNKNQIPREIFCMDGSDKKAGNSFSHASSPKKQEVKDWNTMRSLETTRRSDETLKSSLMCFESRVGKNDVLWVGRETEDEVNRHQNEQQQNMPIDSLHKLSKSSQSIPVTNRSSGASSLRNKSFDESTNRNSSDDYYSEKIDSIESQAPENKSLNPEWEAKTGKAQNLGEFIQVKEFFKAAKGCFHKGRIEVNEESIDDVITNSEMMAQAVEFKETYDEKNDNNDKSVDGSQNCCMNPEEVSTNSNSNEDVPNLKGDCVALGEVSSLPWVSLSHIGHISDYHGYKRRYEQFAPLQFGPLDDIRRQIGRTLIESKHRNDEESDKEVIQDDKDYEQAIQHYKILAEKERSREMKSKIHRNFGVPQQLKKDNLDDMLVVFSSPEVDDKFASPVAKATTKKCNIMKTLDIDESSTLQPPIKFRFFDDEDDVLLNADEDKGKSTHKRKSRSAQIASQKKTSIWILNEMLHTIDFIEKYNRKSKEVQGVTPEVIKDVKKEGINGMGKDDSPIVKKNDQRKMNAKLSNRKVQCGRGTSLAINKLPIKVKPAIVTLTAVSLLKSYKALRKRFSSFHPLHEKGDVEAIKEEIQSILDKDSLLDEFFRDNEITTEEKNLARYIRGYSSKADQEKIEKRNFEEQQKLRQHEFEYYRLRKKKKSPQEIEWKEMSLRPIFYVMDGAPLLTRTDACSFKPNCTICDPTMDDKCCDSTIFFPRFRRIQNNVYIPSGIEPDYGTVGNDNSIFAPPSKGQKLASSLQLLELYHTLDFIENYNNGMIVSRKRRR